MNIPRENVLEARRQIETTLRWQESLYPLARLLGKLPIFKIEYFGEDKLRADEPAVIIATHKNSFDAHTLDYAHLEATGMPLSLTSKESVMDIPVAGILLGKLGSMAVKRERETAQSEQTNRNRTPLINMLARLEAGGSIGTFGEGGRTYGDEVEPIEPSAISLAVKAGVDVVTAGLYGPAPSSPFLPRPMTIVFGSRTNPADIAKPERPEFYRRQIQRDYDTARLIHHTHSN